MGSLGVEHWSCRPVEFSLAGFGRLVVLVGEVRIRRRSGRRDRLGVGAHRKPAQDRGCRAWVADGRDEAVAPPAIALGGIDAGSEQDVGDAISARSFEPDGDGVFVELFQTLIWDRRSSQIAAEPFQAISFVGADADARVEVESVGLGA